MKEDFVADISAPLPPDAVSDKHGRWLKALRAAADLAQGIRCGHDALLRVASRLSISRKAREEERHGTWASVLEECGQAFVEQCASLVEACQGAPPSLAPRILGCAVRLAEALGSTGPLIEALDSELISLAERVDRLQSFYAVALKRIEAVAGQVPTLEAKVKEVQRGRDEQQVQCREVRRALARSEQRRVNAERRADELDRELRFVRRAAGVLAGTAGTSLRCPNKNTLAMRRTAAPSGQGLDSVTSTSVGPVSAAFSLSTIASLETTPSMRFPDAQIEGEDDTTTILSRRDSSTRIAVSTEVASRRNSSSSPQHHPPLHASSIEAEFVVDVPTAVVQPQAQQQHDQQHSLCLPLQGGNTPRIANASVLAAGVAVQPVHPVGDVPLGGAALRPPSRMLGGGSEHSCADEDKEGGSDKELPLPAPAGVLAHARHSSSAAPCGGGKSAMGIIGAPTSRHCLEEPLFPGSSGAPLRITPRTLDDGGGSRVGEIQCDRGRPNDKSFLSFDNLGICGPDLTEGCNGPDSDADTACIRTVSMRPLLWGSKLADDLPGVDPMAALAQSAFAHLSALVRQARKQQPNVASPRGKCPANEFGGPAHGLRHAAVIIAEWADSELATTDAALACSIRKSASHVQTLAALSLGTLPALSLR